MLLNRIPVLDKGYVALIDSCNTTQKLRDMGEEFFGGTYPTSLEELGSMTVVMKCPLFVQLVLSKFNLRIIDANDKNGSTVAYIPNPGEVGARDRLIAEAISDDISRTTDALLINPKAYQADGAEHFVSQVTTPINVYSTIIVGGGYGEWCKFAYDKKLPGPIKEYAQGIGQILEAEWK